MALCGLSSLGQSNLFMLPAHPRYLSIYSFRSPHKRGLIVNKAKGFDRALDTCSGPNHSARSGSISEDGRDHSVMREMSKSLLEMYDDAHMSFKPIECCQNTPPVARIP